MTSACEIAEIIELNDPDRQEELARMIAERSDISRRVLESALENARVRRWARSTLLPKMTPEHRASLAEELLNWPDDFAPDRRDQSTLAVVAALTDQAVIRSILMLAGSNAASALWARFAGGASISPNDAAHHVLHHGDATARETTLHLLALDPYGPRYLTDEEQDALLLASLEDDDPEIRGLAADVVAVSDPDALLDRSGAPLDASERLRMAYWRAAFVHRPEQAFNEASALALTAEVGLEARRSALLALGESVPTRLISPVLQAVFAGSNETLAEDAAQLMWRYHRTPDIANAASESRFEAVRALAERLLHPERGSPAAGGSRPGDPTRTAELMNRIAPGDRPNQPEDCS
jgi:hypothetical protein